MTHFLAKDIATNGWTEQTNRISSEFLLDDKRLHDIVNPTI
jgi:hypothetical protein